MENGCQRDSVKRKGERNLPTGGPNKQSKRTGEKILGEIYEKSDTISENRYNMSGFLDALGKII